jgi:hypothetical protein
MRCEPRASAGEEGRFLILDLRGGTFDVSLLHKYDGVMEGRASSGDAMLGGNDFREAPPARACMRADGAGNHSLTTPRLRFAFWPSLPISNSGWRRRDVGDMARA